MTNADLAIWLACGFGFAIVALAFGHIALVDWLDRRGGLFPNAARRHSARGEKSKPAH